MAEDGCSVGLAKLSHCGLKKVLPMFDCSRCRVGQRWSKADLKEAHGLFAGGRGLSIEAVAMELGFRPTSVAFKLLSHEVAICYQALFNTAAARGEVLSESLLSDAVALSSFQGGEKTKGS